MKLHFTSCFVVACLCGPGCAFWPDHDEAAASSAAFIALPRDFDGLGTWPTIDVTSEVDVDGHGDPASRQIRINRLPGATDKRFGVGTILVKDGAGENGDEFHVMVKRGGNFNTAGAAQWEWMNVGLSDDNRAVIVWRGTAPPSGEGYGCLPGRACGAESDCNTCHAGAVGNDYVFTDALTLGAINVD